MKDRQGLHFTWPNLSLQYIVVNINTCKWAPFRSQVKERESLESTLASHTK